DSKRVAADIDEAVTAVEGRRARVLGEDREIEDVRAGSRPRDAPCHQRGGDAAALCRMFDIELVKFGRACGGLAGRQVEIDRAELDEALDRVAVAADQRDRPV